MCNSIFIDKKTLPKAKDGEEFEVMVKGIYHTDEDGARKLDVMTIDGKDVVGPEEETPCGMSEDLMSQDADDALRLFIIKTKPGK